MTTQKKTHKITITAMMAAVGVLLQFLEFPLPFLVPPFVKMDFSELPALLASFSLGPVYGVAVCLLKNCVKLLTTYSGGIGDVAGADDGNASQIADGTGGLIAHGGIAAADGDGVAVLGKGDGNGRADSAGCAGNDGNLLFHGRILS